MKLMLLLLLSLIVSCNGLEDLERTQKNAITAKSEKLTAPLSDEDFIIKSDDTIIELGMNYKDLKTDEKITDAHYANEQRSYDTIIYENFMVSYGIEIFMIALTTPVFETSRGIQVGDSISSAFENYGMVRKNERVLAFQVEYYRYSDSQKALIFYVDENEVITRIQYEFDHI